MTTIEKNPAAFSKLCQSLREKGETLGFVPTMGALHDGHLELVRQAKKRCSRVAVSIFVNPTQFGPNEDFSRYPRDLEGDARKLAAVDADVIFAPDSSDIYGPNDATRVIVSGLTKGLCGPFRPGHFEGVATIVTKLFGIVGPSTAIFGRKDFQQLAVIRRMVSDLFLPIVVVGAPIVREPDGLAMSSRNAYLSAEERKRALGLSRGLRRSAEAFEAGERRVKLLQSLVEQEVSAVSDSIDYVSCVSSETLEPLEGEVATTALIAIACRVGKTRLIDNFVLGEDSLGAFSRS